MVTSKPKVFSFYSYKGGTGRTTASANVSTLLAAQGHKVLCLDLDLEGPGIGIVFNIPEDEPFPLQNYFEGKHELVRDDFISLEPTKLISDSAGALWVMPASTRLPGVIDISKGGRLLGQLRKLIDFAEKELGVEIVIIDSPSGFGDLSALSMYVSNCVVALFRYSRQHVLGTARVSDFVKKYKLHFITAASCVPLQDSPEKAKYEAMIRKFYRTNIVEIKEDDTLKWQERVVVGSTGNGSVALKGYEELTAKLTELIAT
jgi:MinD-like ATPase involved in chromosome partitioning or flagellar assembly